MHNPIVPVPDDYTPYQGLDGTGFLSYFSAHKQLSFVWDGTSAFIEVSFGGYGEPVTHLINAPHNMLNKANPVFSFQLWCRNALERTADSTFVVQHRNPADGWVNVVDNHRTAAYDCMACANERKDAMHHKFPDDGYRVVEVEVKKV